MMGSLGSYILSIVAVCIACSITQKLTAGQGASAAVIRVLCGVALTVTVISPMVKLKIADLADYTAYVQTNGDHLVQEGVARSNQQLRTIITDQITAYILEKASLYDCSIDRVEVVLTDDPVPVPDAVEITGIYSPHIKKYLSDIIETNLGILKEKQQWTYLS